MNEKIYVSPEGLAHLTAKLDAVRDDLQTLRKEKALAYTATGDTWHDNPYFNRLEQDEARKVAELADVSALIAGAEVVSFQTRNTERVALGSIVKLARTFALTGASDKMLVEVAGYGETDTSKACVAYNAPLLRPLIGLGIGDIASGDSPRGPVEYEILALYPSWELASIAGRSGT